MEYISICGLLCNECPVFIATKTKDEKMKERLALEYSTDDKMFSKFDIRCDGCFSEKASKTKICMDCPMRVCGFKKPVENCGYCTDYPCDIIEEHVPKGSENRNRLDEINDTYMK